MKISRPVAMLMAAFAFCLTACVARADERDNAESQIAVDIKFISLERDTADYFLALAGFQEITGCGPEYLAQSALLTGEQYQAWLALFNHDLISKLTIETLDVPTIVASRGESSSFEVGDQQALRVTDAEPEVSKDRQQSFYFLTGPREKAASVAVAGEVCSIPAPDAKSIGVSIHLTRTAVYSPAGPNATPLTGHAGKLTLDQAATISKGQTAVYHLGTTLGKNAYSYAVPGLSKLPYIGDNFQFNACFQGEREVFVLITPRIVPE